MKCKPENAKLLNKTKRKMRISASSIMKWNTICRHANKNTKSISTPVYPLTFSNCVEAAPKLPFT